MLKKIFLLAVAVAALVMIVLTYAANSKLNSIGFAPATVAENYLIYQSYYQQFLVLSSLILLILANVLLWKERRAWALWTTLAYFSIFVLLQGWWLDANFFTYKKQNNLWQGEFSLSGFVSALFCVAAAVGIFFNQFLVLKMRDRIHGQPAIEQAELVQTDADVEKNDFSGEIKSEKM